MNVLSTTITFIGEKRKTLASIFLVIGLCCSTVFITLLLQRPQEIRSRASDAFDSQSTLTEFISPQNHYKLVYNQTMWTPTVETAYDGSTVVFTLNKAYGFARLDIIEGKSRNDLESLKNELLANSPSAPVSIEASMFHGKPSYEMHYKEEILGENVFYSRHLVKNGDAFVIFEKRAPQLAHDETFLDTIIQSVSLTDAKTQEVQGASSSLSELTSVQLVDLVRPSIVQIVHIYCLEINTLQPLRSGLAKPVYTFCTSTKGSGFVVNEEGIIATNGHIAYVYPQEALVANLLYDGTKTFSTDLVRGMYLARGQNPTKKQVDDFYNELRLQPQHIDRLLIEIFGLIEKEAIALKIVNEKFFVNVGSDPLKIDYQSLRIGDYANAVISSSTTYRATFLDANYPNRYSFTKEENAYVRGPDVGLLQIEGPPEHVFPALVLGSTENQREGSEIFVLGYPTLVEGEEDPRASISYKTSTKPTISRGIISAVKEDLTGRTILQTDASIDHGNSGGPAIDSQGEVVGIATFAVESKSGNFNFLRGVNELKELLIENNLENKLGLGSNAWRDGLTSFHSKRYSEAITYFKKVETISPSHPTVNEFIQLSEEAIARGESVEGITGFLKTDTTQNQLIIGFGMVSLISFTSSGFLIGLPLLNSLKARLLQPKDPKIV